MQSRRFTLRKRSGRRWLSHFLQFFQACLQELPFAPIFAVGDRHRGQPRLDEVNQSTDGGLRENHLRLPSPNSDELNNRTNKYKRLMKYG